MPTITFHVDGDPKPQPRAQARGWIGKKKNGEQFVTARTWNPGTAEGWKNLIVAAAQPHRLDVPFTEPVILELRIWLRRPGTKNRKKDPAGEMPHDGPGDCDNFAKAVLDVLTQVAFWRDDKQVYRLVVEKLYVPKNGRPGMDVKLSWTSAEDAELWRRVQEQARIRA